MDLSQSARAVAMVRPTSFGFDTETAQSNTFQHYASLDTSTILKLVNDEFEQVVQILRFHNIDVTVIEDSPTPPKPNAVFPNNWLSTWPNGDIYLYPMATKSRRFERTEQALDSIKERFAITRAIDISTSENENRFLESTGVIVFHHPSKTAYGCISLRCDEELFKEHVTKLGYAPILFHGLDEASAPIYHTNVMMGIQSTTAVVCLEAIHDITERKKVFKSLKTLGLKIVVISYVQMNAFCGNVLELQSMHGERFLTLSQTAYDHFTQEQREVLSRDKILLPLSVPTIEMIGGGSVRCMLAELFLPTKK